MTDRPILMSTPMVRALLDGRKTQTRRLAWRQFKPDTQGRFRRTFHRVSGGLFFKPTIWPSVKPGDRLWVRETWRHTAEGVWTVQSARNAYGGKVEYKADHLDAWHGGFPSIHMPREFSRLTLIVTATKMERVQEIGEEDAEAEGMKKPILPHWPTAPFGSAFRGIWRSLHTKPGARWEDNPEVVALTFTVHQRNIDAMENAA